MTAFFAGERPMRILMTCARYRPLTGGTETHVHEVAGRMVAAGHSVTVLTTDADEGLPRTELTQSGVKVVRVPAFPRSRDMRFAPGVASLVARRLGARADVVHVQGYHTFVAPLAMAGALLADRPFVLTFHSGGHSSRIRRWLRSTQQRLLAPLASRAARLVGVSEFEADHFSKVMGIPRSRFVVVPNGASLPLPSPDALPPDRDRSGQSPLVVSLGRLERYKGHQRVILAFAWMRRRIPGARLRILGDGPYEPELRELVRKLRLEHAVEIGAVPAGDRVAMANILSGASLVTLLSDYEAHPVAVMEALSLGIPVVTTDTSGFKELAERNLVRAVRAGAPCEHVATAMAEELRRDRRTVVGLPDWDECAGNLLSIYRSVARPRQANGDVLTRHVGNVG